MKNKLKFHSRFQFVLGMFYYFASLFFAAVVYQTIAKKTNLPLLSNGLETMRDNAIKFWDWLGERFARLLNIEKWCKQVWDFIVKHVWENIRIFLESFSEVGEPIWQFLFSWGYFFVGFARAHSIFFSYLGSGIIIFTVGYFTYDYWTKQRLLYLAVSMPVGLIGVTTAYPSIISQIFPRTSEFLEKQYEKPTREYFTGFRKDELHKMLVDKGLRTTGLKTKEDLIQALLSQSNTRKTPVIFFRHCGQD